VRVSDKVRAGPVGSGRARVVEFSLNRALGHADEQAVDGAAEAGAEVGRRVVVDDGIGARVAVRHAEAQHTQHLHPAHTLATLHRVLYYLSEHSLNGNAPTRNVDI